MSRRPPQGPDRTEQNRATLKQLVKLESNKSCADCKRNKHPRWASWNLGVFVCIRCSGIHRGMGTHVSRVKSVDLDSWTDEQLQNMLKWGNARANKYWEHKLAEGHVPNESKIENFIRTKYDSKRWVMDGPMPDPSTLDSGEADDDVPLNVVQEKAKMEMQRGGSLRNGSAPGAMQPPPRQKQPEIDLFGDDSDMGPPSRPSTTEPATTRPGPPKAPAAPPKQTRPGDSLLGLDFFGNAQGSAPARPSSTGPTTPGVSGRSDLKQSILSLYASKPAAPPPQPAANAFSGMQMNTATSPPQPRSGSQDLGGLGNAFDSLSFSSPQPSQAKATPFSNFSAPSGHSRQTSSNKPSLSGGSFFDAKPMAPAKASSPPSQPFSSNRPTSSSFGADFGDFSSAPPPVTSTKSPPPPSSSMGDLFDLGAPSPPAQQTMAPALAPSATLSPTSPSYSNRAFNLSQPTPASAPKPATPAQTSPVSNFSGFSNMDAWGSNDAWSTPDPPAAAPTNHAPSQASASTFKPTRSPAPVVTQMALDSGWGDPEPPVSTTASNAGGFSVQQDEEFGGWSHASPVATSSAPKQSGLGGNSDDLFGNVWE